MLPRCGLIATEYSEIECADKETAFIVTADRWWKFFSSESVGKQTEVKLLKSRLWDALNKTQWRALLNGATRADGAICTNNDKYIFTSSTLFRDELLRMCINAGYTASYQIRFIAGDICSYYYNDANGNRNRCEQLDHVPEGCIGTPIHATSEKPQVVYTPLDERATDSDTLSTPVLQATDIQEVPYNGAVWCVRVDHPDHLVIVQRAHRRSDGIVSKSSRPMVIGQCWHVEDHWTFSVNYVHQGAAKQWYGVPSTSAGKFERKMRQALPNLFALNPDLLFQLVTMLNPSRLATHNSDATSSPGSTTAGSTNSDDPSVYYLLQNAGEFVISFPRSYHAGLNHGFNVAESVNFGGVEWVPYGMKCIERYRFFRRTPIFNHEELIMRMSEATVSAFEKIVKLAPLKRKHRLRHNEAHKMFRLATAALSTTTNATSSGLHSVAQRNQGLSLARFEDIWYFAAWLLHQVQELLAREVAGRNSLLSSGTSRGKIWLPESSKKSIGPNSLDPKRNNFTPLPIGTLVSATWQGNPIYNTRAPTDPSLFICNYGTIIGWDGVSGNYSVIFHEDNLVDEHVLPKHVRYKGAVIGTGGKAAENEWLTYQSLRDPNESKPDSNSPDAPGMKKKIKKSAVDFAPAVSDMTACAICRHALYLSCVRCNCSPEKASC